MKYRQLGAAGVKVSVLGLGSYLTIGMSVDEAASRAIVRRAYDLGVNFFDTANAYNRGEAEKVLGRQLADFPRESLVIATKAWAPMGDGPNDAGPRARSTSSSSATPASGDSASITSTSISATGPTRARRWRRRFGRWRTWLARARFSTGAPASGRRG